jgi:hypothetical protein
MNKMNLINNGWVFVYQGQKVHVFCPSLSFLAEAQLELGNKTRNLLFAIQLPIYIIIIHIYDKTIIGFVGLVVNSLNRQKDGATVGVRKNYFLSACEYIKWVSKNLLAPSQLSS